ncbi:DUF3710 domain-containing protein [uncultured Friedmanniella sp.]|uniref:DUF3710 domain-containing protein n=1 Tax=uncultured Friedmanniella sp. TaxID=335381 RepID=UPI0035C9F3C5
MIFRRNKKRVDELETEDAGLDAETSNESTDPDAELVDEGAADEAGEDEADESAEVELDVEALDATDWRTEGPYDISEVDDLTGTPEVPRIDLGAMVLAGFPGAELRLQMSEETQQIVSAMLLHAESALEVGAYAAPRSGGLWSELREEIMASAIEVGGSAALAEGPFGVELRRFIPVTTPEGDQGYQPSRMWVAEGPRWLLRGIVYGQAALEDGVESPVAELVEAFRQIVVRRGDEAMAPGDLLPLTMPQNLVAEEPEDEV